MARKYDLIENDDGVHGTNPSNSEYTLCGDAWDGNEDDGYTESVRVDDQRVTCPKCVEVIRYCKRLKI